MAVFSTLIGLQASPTSRGVDDSVFLDALAITPEDRIEATDGPRFVQFPIIRLSQCQGAAEPSEEFDARTRQVLLLAAEFLNRREPKVLERIRTAGMRVRIFVDLRMDQDQFEFDLPAEFVRACGRHGLGIFVMSNDISAEEALRSRGEQRA
jgi:hypothetical protein